MRSAVAIGTCVLTDIITSIDHQCHEWFLLIAYCPAPGIATEPDWLWKRIGSTAGIDYTGNQKAY